MEKEQIIKTELENIIKKHEKYYKSYFWKPRPNAAERCATGFDSDYEFELEGKKYEIRQRYEESCEHCYYSLIVYVDGKKKDVSAIKKALTIN